MGPFLSFQILVSAPLGLFVEAVVGVGYFYTFALDSSILMAGVFCISNRLVLLLLQSLPCDVTSNSYRRWRFFPIRFLFPAFVAAVGA